MSSKFQAWWTSCQSHYRDMMCEHSYFKLFDWLDWNVISLLKWLWLSNSNWIRQAWPLVWVNACGWTTVFLFYSAGPPDAFKTHNVDKQFEGAAGTVCSKWRTANFTLRSTHKPSHIPQAMIQLAYSRSWSHIASNELLSSQPNWG